MAGKETASPELKNALICLISCARETKDASLMANAVQKMGQFFPADADYAKNTRSSTGPQICEDQGDLNGAYEQLQRVLIAFPDYEGKEADPHASKAVCK